MAAGEFNQTEPLRQSRLENIALESKKEMPKEMPNDPFMKDYVKLMIRRNNNNNFYTLRAITLLKSYFRGNMERIDFLKELGSNPIEYGKYLKEREKKELYGSF